MFSTTHSLNIRHSLVLITSGFVALVMLLGLFGTSVSATEESPESEEESDVQSEISVSARDVLTALAGGGISSIFDLLRAEALQEHAEDDGPVAGPEGGVVLTQTISHYGGVVDVLARVVGRVGQSFY